jgi:hypothetical protein
LHGSDGELGLEVDDPVAVAVFVDEADLTAVEAVAGFEAVFDFEAAAGAVAAEDDEGFVDVDAVVEAEAAEADQGVGVVVAAPE